MPLHFGTLTRKKGPCLKVSEATLCFRWLSFNYLCCVKQLETLPKVNLLNQFYATTSTQELNRACAVPGNPGKYLDFSLIFSRTGKYLKMVGGPGKPWKFVTQVIKFS